MDCRHGVVNLLCTLAIWQRCGVDTPTAINHYKNHRFPVESISPTVWLYLRLGLSFRDVEELLWERGVIVTDEDIRKWCRKFGQQ
jgi:putative transposase